MRRPPEAAAEIERPAEMLVGQPVGREAIGVLVLRALRREIDGAAKRRAAGRGAEQEGAGAVEDLDLVVEFGRDQLARRDAEQAVDRDILTEQVEAADDELLGHVAEAERGADRGIILQHRAERQRLLVEDQRFVVALDRKGCVHRVLVTQRAERAVAADLGLVVPLGGDDDVFSCRFLRKGGCGERGGESGDGGSPDCDMVGNHVQILPRAGVACPSRYGPDLSQALYREGNMRVGVGPRNIQFADVQGSNRVGSEP